MYKIEKNIPIPKKSNRPRKYNFQNMEVGDSFFVRNGKQKVVASSAAYYSFLYDKEKKFTVRNVEGGIRCWRIK